jgi:hypothetical protein
MDVFVITKTERKTMSLEEAIAQGIVQPGIIKDEIGDIKARLAAVEAKA